MEKQVLEQSWYLETVTKKPRLHTNNPSATLFDDRSIANGGFKIKPNIIYNNNFNYEEILSKIQSEKNKPIEENITRKNINLYEKLYKILKI